MTLLEHDPEYSERLDRIRIDLMHLMNNTGTPQNLLDAAICLQNEAERIARPAPLKEADT
jgi:hypothetical protein